MVPGDVDVVLEFRFSEITDKFFILLNFSPNFIIECMRQGVLVRKDRTGLGWGMKKLRWKDKQAKKHIGKSSLSLLFIVFEYS